MCGKVVKQMKKDLGLYLHVPFCVKKCNYCDFLSKEATEEEKEAYVDALIKEIKSNSFERLEHKPDKVEIITSTSVPAITENFKNPILLNLNGNKVENEKDLEKLIYSQLSYVFMQLGNDFTWVGNQYKISDGNKNYYIEMLL